LSDSNQIDFEEVEVMDEIDLIAEKIWNDLDYEDEVCELEIYEEADEFVILEEAIWDSIGDE